MEFKCGKCGHTHFYLKEVGPNTGIFCSKCHRWQNWVAKKDIDKFVQSADDYLKPLQKPSQPNSAVSAQVDQNTPNAALRPRIGAPLTLDELLSKMKDLREKLVRLNREMNETIGELANYSILAEERMREQSNDDDDDGELPWDD